MYLKRGTKNLLRIQLLYAIWSKACCLRFLQTAVRCDTKCTRNQHSSVVSYLVVSYGIPECSQIALDISVEWLNWGSKAKPMISHEGSSSFCWELMEVELQALFNAMCNHYWFNKLEIYSDCQICGFFIREGSILKLTIVPMVPKNKDIAENYLLL